MNKDFVWRIVLCVLSTSLGFYRCTETDGFYQEEEVNPNCRRLVHGPCDVRQYSCQRDLFEIAICARDDGYGILPEVLTIDREELRGLLSEPDDSEEEISPEEGAWTKALQLLGLLPEKVSMGNAVSDELVEDIVGFYSSETQDLVIVDYGMPMDSYETNVTLIHEFVHALQDQTIGLEGFGEELRKTTDGAIARKALIEGEAIHYMVIGISLMESADPELVDWDSYYEEVAESMLEDIEDAEVPLAAVSSSIPYMVGGPYITAAYLLNGDLSNTALYDDPITTTVEWMLGFGGADFERASLSCTLPQAPEDAEQLDRDRLGAAGVLALLVENGMKIDSAWELTKKWRWDEIAVYGSEQTTDSSNFVAWRIAWDSDDDASEFAAALSENGFIDENRKVELDEREILIVAGERSVDLQRWREDIECVAPQDADDDEPFSGMRKTLIPIHSIWFR